MYRFYRFYTRQDRPEITNDVSIHWFENSMLDVDDGMLP